MTKYQYFIIGKDVDLSDVMLNLKFTKGGVMNEQR